MKSDEPHISGVLSDTMVRVAVVGIFLIMSVAVLYFAKDFLLPVVLAFLLALVLAPGVRMLERRRVPAAASACALVSLIVVGLIFGLYNLSAPVTKWIGDAPSIASEIQLKLRSLREPVDAVQDAASEVEGLTEKDDPGVQSVVVKEPGLVARAATGAPEIVAKIVLTLVLLLFLLASGDLFYEKLVKTLPTLTDKKRGVRITRAVEREVSRYLFAITLINVGLGVCIGIALYMVGMPNPVLWGVFGALLNFVPYLGAAAGVLTVGAVAFVSLDPLGHALLAPAAYLGCTAIEGQLITPMLVGRRLEINAVAIFLAMAFWGWLWGVVGLMIAVPILVVVKVFAEHMEGLGGVGEFLAARDGSAIKGPSDDAAPPS